jgi:energy-coupling factor transport system permease protein
VASRTLEAGRYRAAASRGSGGLHAGAWLAWLLAVSAFVFLTSNPLYITLALLAAAGAYLAVRDTAKGRAMTPFVVLGLALAALSVTFNLITGSNGETVLLALPSLTFPDWFGGVTLGGNVTAEQLVTAGTRALSIGSLVLAAAAFNGGVDHFRLLRLAPRGLSQVMAVFTIAALVVPQGFAQAKAVAEGRRLRGREGRGLCALPALVLPVLQGALERSVQRAESLDARGFGGGAAGSRWTALLGVGGLGLAAWGAFAHFYYGAAVLPSLAMAIGLALVAAMLYAGGARRRAFLRTDPLTDRDWLLLACAALSLALVLALRLAGAGDVTYLPYPDLAWPAFHPAGAVAAVVLLAPALLYSPERAEALA